MAEMNERQKVLNTFLSTVFDNQIPKRFPDLELTDEVKPLYFKIWCAGVYAGLELNDAIAEMKEWK